MKPAHVGLLVLLSAASLLLFAVLALSPSPMRAFVEPGGSSGPTKSTQHPPRRETSGKSTQRKSTGSGGVFSGSDPSDPRVYH